MEIKQAIAVNCKAYYRVLSPGVGLYLFPPENNTPMEGNAPAGKLRTLNTLFDLVLPEEVHGRVILNKEIDKITPVEYGQELFRLEIVTKELNKTNIDNIADQNESGSEAGQEIKAFSSGIFYRKASPDSPPYVEEGQRIEKGKILCLIEVMKTFNRILYQGSDKSEYGIIRKILVKDGSEVKMGQTLFLIDRG